MGWVFAYINDTMTGCYSRYVVPLCVTGIGKPEQYGVHRLQLPDCWSMYRLYYKYIGFYSKCISHL